MWLCIVYMIYITISLWKNTKNIKKYICLKRNFATQVLPKAELYIKSISEVWVTETFYRTPTIENEFNISLDHEEDADLLFSFFRTSMENKTAHSMFIKTNSLMPYHVHEHQWLLYFWEVRSSILSKRTSLTFPLQCTREYCPLCCLYFNVWYGPCCCNV